MSVPLWKQDKQAHTCMLKTFTVIVPIWDTPTTTISLLQRGTIPTHWGNVACLLHLPPYKKTSYTVPCCHSRGRQRRLETQSSVYKTWSDPAMSFSRAAEHLSHNYLPIRRIGRGPNLSIRMPSGSVVALSRKLPMVKPKFNISSWSTQLGHTSVSSLAVKLSVTFSAAKGDFWRQIFSFILAILGKNIK